MKKTLSLLLLLFLMNTVRAQRQNTYFFKNNSRQVTLRDSADFIRIIQEPDPGSTHFKLKEYYTDGTEKVAGYISRIFPLVYEGSYQTFNQQGKRMDSVYYLHGKITGQASYYYPDGQLRELREYPAPQVESNSGQEMAPPPKSKLIYWADSTGKVLVKAGNGYFIKTYQKGEKDEFTVEGQYANGYKTGEWKMKSLSGNDQYKEFFEDGKMQKGERVKDGNTYVYTQETEKPEFESGLKDLYKYIGKGLRYPADAVEKGISGTVGLSFMVEKDGQVTDLLVSNSVYPSLDQEAFRILKNCPKWKPGKEHGIPVRVRYNLPVTFSFGR